MPKLHINGTLLHYHTDGAGTPILFIHPPLINRAIFRYQEVQLADRFQVVTFDIRGHGFSPRSETPITYPLIVEDTIRLMDELGLESAYLCGYSTGGSIVLEALLTHPERFRGGICLGAMSEVSDWNVKAQISAAALLTKLNMKTTAALLISKANADMRDTFHNLYYVAIRGDVENWRQYFEASKHYYCTDRLMAIRQPVLLIYGDRDWRFKGYGHQLHRMLPNAALAFIPGAKHYIPTKNSAEFHDLLTKWVMEQEIKAASEGDGKVDWALAEKAEQYGVPIPEEAAVEMHENP
ncbi:alpha/beta fold hydrolase [Paenibacillus thermotolerans]|uniref:alpha/beta fold hydrolase n=1 Tax=Paenibacillus thermotolerans TaxID=3027807 RepID=UPI002368828C|nr:MULTISPECIES: alpha/beta hydrolase [unclassified Paenibacillus]